MKIIKKSILIILIFAYMITGCGFAFESRQKIGKDAALEIALEDAKLTRDQVSDIDIDYEWSLLRFAWYEIDFEKGRIEYEYKIDAYTGEILSAKTD